MAKQLKPITPGEILRNEFMAEYGLSQNKLALDLNTPASIVNRIVNNKLRITADMALRLGKYFGTTAQFWIGGGPMTVGRLHFAFSAESRKAVDEFHSAALRYGAVSTGEPGQRSNYGENYYAAFVLDPNGHTIEAVCRVAE